MYSGLACRTEETLDELANWSEFGRKTICNYGSQGIPSFTNEFWTSRQRAAHSLHEVSYRACFKPQLPGFFISRLTQPGDLVFDPFMGRGTTLIEASLLGRNVLGNDVNPLSRILVEPRLAPPGLGEIGQRLEQIRFAGEIATPPDFEVFFERKTLQQICNLRAYLQERRQQDKLDNIDRWIEMVAISRLTGHSSGFFSVYTLPPNQAVTIESQRKINAKRRQCPEYRDVSSLILRKSRSLLRDLQKPVGRCVGVMNSEIKAGLDYKNRDVVLSVTSPPFMNIVNYRQDNWLRCWFAGIDPDRLEISQSADLQSWQKLVRATLEQVAAITRSGGYFAFEVGEIQNGQLLLEQIVIEMADTSSWRLLAIIINQQEFTKTSNSWGISNNSIGTNSNRIVLMQLD